MCHSKRERAQRPSRFFLRPPLRIAPRGGPSFQHDEGDRCRPGDLALSPCLRQVPPWRLLPPPAPSPASSSAAVAWRSRDDRKAWPASVRRRQSPACSFGPPRRRSDREGRPSFSHEKDARRRPDGNTALPPCPR